MLVLTRSAPTAFGPRTSAVATTDCVSTRAPTRAGPPTAPVSPGALRRRLGTVLMTANATVHYGNDGGFAAASFSDGAPPFTVFGTCQTPIQLLDVGWSQQRDRLRGPPSVLQVARTATVIGHTHGRRGSLRRSAIARARHRGQRSALVRFSGPRSPRTAIASRPTTVVVAGRSAIYVNGIKSRGVDFCPPNHGSDTRRLDRARHLGCSSSQSTLKRTLDGLMGRTTSRSAPRTWVETSLRLRPPDGECRQFMP